MPKPAVKPARPLKLRPTPRQLAEYGEDPVLPPIREIRFCRAGAKNRYARFSSSEEIEEFLLTGEFLNFPDGIRGDFQEWGWTNVPLYLEDLFGDPALVLADGQVVIRATPALAGAAG